MLIESRHITKEDLRFLYCSNRRLVDEVRRAGRSVRKHRRPQASWAYIPLQGAHDSGVKHNRAAAACA
jgi:hypothetical protein